MSVKQKDHDFTARNGFPSSKRICWRIRAAGRWLSASRIIAGAFAFLCVIFTESQGAITFDAPFRSVSASHNQGSSETTGAYDSERFNHSVRVDWEEYWGHPANTTGQYYAEAYQDSMIGLNGIAAKGSVIGNGSFYYWGQTPLEIEARSYFEIYFTIHSPSNLHLFGTVDFQGDFQGTNYVFPDMRILLSGSQGEILSQNLMPWESSESHILNHSFPLLAAGNYQFSLSARSAGVYSWHQLSDSPGIGGFGKTVYDITLIPEPGIMVLWSLGGLLMLTRRGR